MPATSQAQQRLMGAELRRRRAGKKGRLKGMSTAQVEEFASTPRGKLVERKSRTRYRSR